MTSCWGTTVDQRHFNALLALELKRARPVVTRLAIATPLAVAVFLLLDRGTAENLLAVVLGAGLGVAAVGVPITVMRDKLDGSLEFLVTLPTSATTLAAAKFAAAALAGLPWALATAVVVVVRPPLPLGADPVGAAGAVMIAAWCGLAALSWSATAVWARFDPKRVGLFPLAAVVLLALGGSVMGRVLKLLGVEDLSVGIARLLAAPWLPLAAAAAGLVLFATIGLVSFLVTRRAFERFRPAAAEM